VEMLKSPETLDEKITEAEKLLKAES